MMNIPAELAGKALDGLKGSPIILGLLLLNMIMLAGFAYTLSQVAHGLERRDAMIKTCLEERT